VKVAKREGGVTGSDASSSPVTESSSLSMSAKAMSCAQIHMSVVDMMVSNKHILDDRLIQDM
jgi:hypothetical protein